MRKRKELEIYFEMSLAPLPPEREAAYNEALGMIADMILEDWLEEQKILSHGEQEIEDSNPSFSYSLTEPE